MIKDIVTYDIKSKDNPKVLIQKTREVTDFNSQEVKDCIRDLNDTMTDLVKREGNKRGAIGLAAPQIGVDLAMTLVEFTGGRTLFINPKLRMENGEKRLFRIGCFSLYEYRALVYYNDDVIVQYQDEEGDSKTMTLKGDRSCVVQHEMDHLEGDLLFAHLLNKEKDLFIPRESVYKNGKVPLRNYGPIFEYRRRKGKTKVLSAPVFYSALFNDYTDYCRYVDKFVRQENDLFEMITKYTPNRGKVLEIGCGTSAISVHLSAMGYSVYSNQIDKDMLQLSKAINAYNKTDVIYSNDDLDTLFYDTGKFDTVFSYEVLETLNEDQLVKALKEGLRVGKYFIFKVPTIKIKSNTLKGNEILRSADKWLQQLTRLGFNIVETKLISEDQYAIFVINN